MKRERETKYSFVSVSEIPGYRQCRKLRYVFKAMLPVFKVLAQ